MIEMILLSSSISVTYLALCLLLWLGGQVGSRDPAIERLPDLTRTGASRSRVETRLLPAAPTGQWLSDRAAGPIINSMEIKMNRTVLAVLAASVGVVAPAALAHAQTTTYAATRAEQDVSETWARIKGAWTQTKGEVKVQWGRLTDDDLTEIDGRRELLVGKIETRYGVDRKEAERQVGGFESEHR